MPAPTKSFCWVFTFQEVPIGEYREFIISRLTRPYVRHARVQLEQAGQTGKFHYQGCVRFTKNVTFSAAGTFFKEMDMKGCHYELMRGTYKQASEYCMKKDTRVHGPWGIGADALIEADKDIPLDGDDDGEPPVRPTHVFKQRTVVCVFGPPKTLKSTAWRLICEYYGGMDNTYYVPGKAKNSSGRWLGDYQGERCAIIEEFDFYNDFDPNQWKMLLDRLPHAIPSGMGGRNVNWIPELVVLISNDPIGRGHPFLSATYSHRIDRIDPWGYNGTEALNPLMCPKTVVGYDLDSFPTHEEPDLNKARRKAHFKEKRKEITIITEDGEVVKPYAPKAKRFKPTIETIEIDSPVPLISPPSPPRSSDHSGNELLEDDPFDVL